jgi:hypothetical protein
MFLRQAAQQLEYVGHGPDIIVAGVPHDNSIRSSRAVEEGTRTRTQPITAAMSALGTSTNGTRRMSAAARRRISLAQKARWAKQRAPKPKRAISAAGRRRIAAAQRARWAKVRRTT